MTGADVLEVLAKHGYDFVRELEPYDRLLIEKELDAELGDAEVELDTTFDDRVEERAKEIGSEVGSRLKERFGDWFTDQLSEVTFASMKQAIPEHFKELVNDVLDEKGINR
ncbi:MAG: hypothetical protein ABI445_19500 [Polyangia bacterium]